MVLCLFSRLMGLFLGRCPFFIFLVFRLGYHHEILLRHSGRFEDS